MTKKQELFVQEYLIDLNATQAAIRAGYSTHTAKEIGCENLAKPNLRACIDKAMAERSKRTGVNADRVIQELARIAFVKANDVVDVDSAKVKSTASDDDKAAIASIKIKTVRGESVDSVEREVRFADKIKALELLGKHMGMFVDNIRMSGDMGVQIINDIPKDKTD